ncbi:hypothetical protein FACS1894101_1550 [Betaproteobacteria bacterium]|nr:hypothetical protein FACS1894101_1550 [Betaproteobacteria bacterium]
MIGPLESHPLLAAQGNDLAGGVIVDPQRAGILQIADPDSVLLRGGTGADGNGVFNGSTWVSAGAEYFPLTYPLTVHLFTFAQEIYLVVNYSVNHYQYLAFGKSVVNGLPGNGCWVSGTMARDYDYNGLSITCNLWTTSRHGLYVNETSAAIFYGVMNSYFYTGFNGSTWEVSDNLGQIYQSNLLNCSPNAWNSEAVLLPLRAFSSRPEGRLSLAVDLQNARTLRVDNYTPGQVITLGSEQWMVFPWYLKNTAARDAGVDLDHTGTFGWAIRYEGP